MNDGDNDTSFTWAHDCKFSGGIDISLKSSLKDECPQLCLANPDCTHFHWGWENNCFMKSSVQLTAYHTKWNGTCGKIHARLGAFDWEDDGEVTWANNCEFMDGVHINEEESSKDDCPQLCVGNAECTHFHWGFKNQCTLISAVDTQLPAYTERRWNGTCGKINARVWTSSSNFKNGKIIYIFKC